MKPLGCTCDMTGLSCPIHVGWQKCATGVVVDAFPRIHAAEIDVLRAQLKEALLALRRVANLCHAASIRHKCQFCQGHAIIAEELIQKLQLSAKGELLREYPCSGCGMVYMGKPSHEIWACDRCLEEQKLKEHEEAQPSAPVCSSPGLPGLAAVPTAASPDESGPHPTPP